MASGPQKTVDLGTLSVRPIQSPGTARDPSDGPSLAASEHPSQHRSSGVAAVRMYYPRRCRIAQADN